MAGSEAVETQHANDVLTLSCAGHLHQTRGRVSRGSHEGRAVAFEHEIRGRPLGQIHDRRCDDVRVPPVAHLEHAARGLASAGAQGLLLATNTMHKVADAIEAAAGLPLLHIADATGAALQAGGVRQAALLGTRFTMEDDTIVRARLQQRFGVAVRVPDEADRTLMHRVIFEELCRGRLLDASRDAIVALIARQRAAGADAVILGCTEIGMLIDAGCSPLPVFDPTELHAAAAVQWMLEPA